MKKIILATLLCGLSATSVFAAPGVFGYGIELTATGTLVTNPGKSLYALDNSGGTRLLLTNSTATLRTTWTSASTQASPTFNLGTFNPSKGDSLILNGGSILTYVNNGSDATGGNQYLNYTIGSNVFTGTNLPSDSTNPSGNNNGDQRFGTEAVGVNLLTGLANGTYTLATYGYASGAYESNAAANYGATFTVVPEPNAARTILLMSGVGLFVVVMRRRASVG